MHAFECNCKKCKKRRKSKIIILQSSIIKLYEKLAIARVEKKMFIQLAILSAISVQKSTLRKLQNPD